MSVAPQPDPRRTLVHLPSALRVHHWVKNLLVFVPLVMSHQLGDPRRLAAACAAFAAFCLCVSACYLLNDLIDLEADRAHPHKRRRPIAAGRLSIPAALAASAALLVSGTGLSLVFLPPLFTAEVLAYAAASTVYSLVIKRLPILDVMFLAGFYAYRVFAGGTAVGVPISPWLLAFSMFFFLSLAFLKRFTDLRDADGRGAGDPRPDRRAYAVSDLDLFRSLGVAAGYVSVLVLALYVRSDDVTGLYPRAAVLWLVCPCLLYWLTRAWLVAHRGRMHHDPIVFAFTDPASYVVGALVVILAAVASGLPG